ncbi:hypothetical protein O6P43_022827 [Quillaja saponaria]|uniref:Uncharacterized protein n=1 Tax=Quillaja saponaria TaxID=32244 RepID=A0AAD7LDY7_QUISA|nr:hypothetical protein O6P43_022827 [Quillaja saponaria]
MDSPNFEGCGKVSHVEDEATGKVSHVEGEATYYKATNKKYLIAVISIFTILFLTLTIGLMISEPIHESETKPYQMPSNSVSTYSFTSVLHDILLPQFLPPKHNDPEAIFYLSSGHH